MDDTIIYFMTTKKKETAVEETTAEKKTRKAATRKTTTRKTTTRRKTTKKVEEEETPVAAAPSPAPVVPVPAAPVPEVPASGPKPEAKPAPSAAPSPASVAPVPEVSTSGSKPEPKPIPPLPQVRIESIVDLINAPHRQLLLSDQQIQQLTLAEAEQRFRFMEGTLAWILNYDVVLSDTNIWIELLVGHTSSHSDPKVNARLLFERQLDFISKLTRFRGARFLMMSETYEEIDRFATAMQSPTNHKDADFSDEAVCRNVAGRLAKRLILSQQRENRLRIEGITSESHHAAFADPAIIRRTVELFAEGKRVLLLTNDASVGIRSIGMCDDLQRTNNIDDETWERVYSPLRPMVFTFDDLKLLDNYTRQYHFLQMAAGKQWMEDVPQSMEKHNVTPLRLWMDGFRSGDRHPEYRNSEQQKKQQPAQNNQQKQQAKSQPKQEPKQEQKQQSQSKQEPVAQPKQNAKPQPKQEPKPQAKQEPKTQQKADLKAPVEEITPQPEAIVESSPVPATPAAPEVAVAETTDANAAPKPKRRSYRRPQRSKKPAAEK